MTVSEKEMLRRIDITGVKIIGKYNGQKIKTEFICTCGDKWITTPYRVSIGTKCKRCGINKQKKPIFGVGINDIEDVTLNYKEIYAQWVRMLERGYDKSFKEKHPTYHDVTVCDEWLVFSNFKKWMLTQDYKNKELDKDILEVGNKIYSPVKCIFVDKRINTLLIDCKQRRGDMPVGVTHTKDKIFKQYRARCQTGKGSKHLGYFETANEAFKAWADFKSKLIAKIAEQQQDKRIKNGLLRHAKAVYLRQTDRVEPTGE